MFSSQDSEAKHAAIEKAQEGWRLLHVGDYEGATVDAAVARVGVPWV